MSARDAMLAQYEAWANGELSEISDEAMAAGQNAAARERLRRDRHLIRSVAIWIEEDGGGDEAACARAARWLVHATAPGGWHDQG